VRGDNVRGDNVRGDKETRGAAASSFSPPVDRGQGEGQSGRLFHQDTLSPVPRVEPEDDEQTDSSLGDPRSHCVRPRRTNNFNSDGALKAAS